MTGCGRDSDAYQIVYMRTYISHPYSLVWTHDLFCPEKYEFK